MIHSGVYLLVFRYALIVLSISIFPLIAPAHAEENSLIQELGALRKQTGIGAIAYALVENNNIVATGGAGQYALDNARPVTADSLFRVGSISKTFTALAVMHLVGQGKLWLDQPVKKSVPAVPLNNPWLKLSPVTLAMVLEHTAGLQDLTREEFNYPDPLSLKQAFQLNPDARQLRWPPGHHYSYSNVGAGYASWMIEAETGENYDSWFKREILDSLSMQASQLHWTKKLEDNLVAGYDADLTTRIPYWHTLFRSFGGLNTNATDMAKFLLLFTSEVDPQRRIVSRSAIQRMETPTTSLAAQVGLITGYGLGIRNTYYKGHRIFGHGGDADGYLAEFAYSKESRRGYFIVINAFRQDVLEYFTVLLNDWLVEDLGEAGAAVILYRNKQIEKQQRWEFTGDYQTVTARFPFAAKIKPGVVQIKEIGEQLYRCFPEVEKCTQILPLTAQLYRTVYASQASMAFVRSKRGCLFLQTGFGSYQKSGNHCGERE